MKKYIYAAIMLMAIVAESVAQQREFPALQINFKDGTSELVTYPISGYRYGVENPKDGDYITCSFGHNATVSELIPGNMVPMYSLTAYGEEALGECTKVGLIFSDTPIDTTAIDVTTLSDFYVIIDGVSENRYASWEYDAVVNYFTTFEMDLGTVYYCLAYYVLDGKTYYSKQVTQVVDKMLADVLKRQGLEALFLDAENAIVLNTENVRNNLYTHYGTASSLCIDSLVSMKGKEYFKTLTKETVKQYATSIEACSDGTIYTLELPESYAQNIINYIEQEANTPFYVKATPETAIYSYSSSNIKREFTTALSIGVALTMVDCEESWGVKDNQYLHTNVPTTSNYSPAIALNLNHLMLPGKKYNVTFSLAPQTDAASVDTLDLQFYVLMADGQGKDNVNDIYPIHRDLKNIASITKDIPCLIKNPAMNPTEYDSCYIFKGYADKVTSYTFEYTPERLVFNHAFKVMNQFNTMLTSYKKKYGHNIRLIGVEVAPAE